MIKKILILVCFIFCSTLFAQNKYPFGILNYSTINPAAVGINNSSIGVYYGTPFSGIVGAPKYQLINFQKNYGDKTGIGLLFDSYTSGPSSFLNVNFSYSHYMKLNAKLSLSLGLSAGIKLFSIDESSFILNDQSDNAISGNLRKEQFSNANTGLVLMNKNWQFGVSVNNLINSELFSTTTDKNELNKPNTISYFNYRFKLENFDINPSALVNLDLAHFSYLMDFNVLIDYRGIQMGTSLRNMERITIISGIKKNSLHLNYAYSFPSSSINNLLSGGQHLIVNFYF